MQAEFLTQNVITLELLLFISQRDKLRHKTGPSQEVVEYYLKLGFFNSKN